MTKLVVRDGRTCQVNDIWLQSIDDILKYWESVDMAAGYAGIHDGMSLAKKWERVFRKKRADNQYKHLKQTIDEQGFTMYLGCETVEPYFPGDYYIEPKVNLRKYPRMGNGHHRLAAAIELGYKYIPMIGETFYANDSDDSTPTIYREQKSKQANLIRQ